MNTYEALESFIKRADRIDVSGLTGIHTATVGNDKVDIMITGEKAEKKTYTELSNGLATLGGNDDIVSDGDIYVEFKDIEIFSSSNPEVVNHIANLIKTRYNDVKTTYAKKFVNLVSEELPPVLPNLDRLSEL